MRSGAGVAAVLVLAACRGGAPLPALRSDVERVRQEVRQEREDSAQLHEQVRQLQQQQAQLTQQVQQLQQQAQLRASAPPGAAQAPERTGILVGEVVSQRGDALVVRDPQGAEFDLRLQARTTLSRGGRPVQRNALQPGTDVRATFDPTQQRWMARSVEVLEAPPAGQAAGRPEAGAPGVAAGAGAPGPGGATGAPPSGAGARARRGPTTPTPSPPAETPAPGR